MKWVKIILLVVILIFVYMASCGKHHHVKTVKNPQNHAIYKYSNGIYVQKIPGYYNVSELSSNLLNRNINVVGIITNETESNGHRFAILHDINRMNEVNGDTAIRLVLFHGQNIKNSAWGNTFDNASVSQKIVKIRGRFKLYTGQKEIIVWEIYYY